MLYNENLIKDKLNILQYIDSYTNAIGLSDVEIDLNKIDLVCLRIRDEFPCKFGISEASIFKKTAVFVSCFIETSPLEKSLLNNSNGAVVDKVKYPSNPTVFRAVVLDSHS